ncbi:MAG: universal stress protein [Polyangiaceae bacterium]
MKKILVGIDTSSRAHVIFKAAQALAQQSHAKLVLMRAVGLPTDLPAEALSIPPGEVTALLEARARADLAKMARDLPEDLDGGVHITVGTPWDAICRAAKAENADLIFIGTHGYGAIDRVLGTTASKVVNHADRPVLIFRERPAEKDGAS